MQPQQAHKSRQKKSRQKAEHQRPQRRIPAQVPAALKRAPEHDHCALIGLRRQPEHDQKYAKIRQAGQHPVHNQCPCSALYENTSRTKAHHRASQGKITSQKHRSQALNPHASTRMACSRAPLYKSQNRVPAAEKFSASM